jgi:formate C-acetyltransferase
VNKGNPKNFRFEAANGNFRNEPARDNLGKGEVGLITETVTDRIAYLRKRVTGVPEVSVQRALLLTESYQETEGEPMVIRRAKALKKVLSEMSVGINDGELIVGSFTGLPSRGSLVLVDYSSDWIEQEIADLPNRSYDKFHMTQKSKEQLRSILPYWHGKTVKDKALSLMGPEGRARYEEFWQITSNDMMLGGQGFAHVSVDYETAINEGLESIKRKAELKLAGMTAQERTQPKGDFYKAAIIALDAPIILAERYARLARELAESDADVQRQMELREIADICQRVPAKPARTFHEALQSLWFVQIALLNEAYGYAFAPGRLDQYLFPFFERDIDNRRLDKPEAKELLQCLYLKFNELTLLIKRSLAEYFAGFPETQLVVLGGVDTEGRDATNELSRLCLEADSDLGLPQPETVIRVHKHLPEDFLMEACQAAKKHRGKLKFIGDDMAIQMKLNVGYPLGDARDYVLVGCFEAFVPKKSHDVAGGKLNLLKCLELALNNGVDPASGKQLGPESGDPTSFTSFEDVVNAYARQVDFFMEHIVAYNSAILEAHSKWAPTPFQSALIQGCLDQGLDCTAGGASFSGIWFSALGVSNVGDSLAAIKKLVFDEKATSMTALIDALRHNFEGYEDLEAMCQQAPKFGNDDDYVDELTRQVVEMFCDSYQRHRIWGRKCIASIGTTTAHIPMGATVGASPEGRRAGMPLADGGLSPAQGRNINGPTATFKSVAKAQYPGMMCGSVLNMRFNPDALKDEVAMRKFAALIRTYFELGGYHVQFNIVDTQTLRDAQNAPDRYRDLLVRVATWTARFVELSPEVQEDIIRRIEFQGA